MDEIADLQAQIIALRMAVEGTWMSLLSTDTDPVAQARLLKEANVAAVDQLDASTPNAKAMRDLVATHTANLWGSIEWQFKTARDQQQQA